MVLFEFVDWMKAASGSEGFKKLSTLKKSTRPPSISSDFLCDTVMNIDRVLLLPPILHAR